MMGSVLSSPFFGLTLTVLCWCGAVKLQKKTGMLICNPVLVCALMVIGVLLVFDIPLEQYYAGGNIIKLMLAPATTVLALNIYQQRRQLGEQFVPVLMGCFIGSLTSIFSIILLSRLLGMDEVFTASMIPKSVTTAIALGVSENAGGIPGVTAAAVIITGVEGAILAPVFAKLFRVKQPVAEGVAIGASSHAIGTSKAMEIGSVQGAMSSIAICICGIFTSVLALFV